MLALVEESAPAKQGGRGGVSRQRERTEKKRTHPGSALLGSLDGLALVASRAFEVGNLGRRLDLDVGDPELLEGGVDLALHGVEGDEAGRTTEEEKEESVSRRSRTRKGEDSPKGEEGLGSLRLLSGRLDGGLIGSLGDDGGERESSGNSSVGLELEMGEGRVGRGKVGVERGILLRVDRVDAAPKMVSS